MKIILTALLLTATPLFAVLPPLAQSEREIKAIMSSQEGYDLLGGQDPIMQIVRTETGYEVITSRKKMKVDVIYEKNNKMVGPGEFKLKFYPPVGSESFS